MIREGAVILIEVSLSSLDTGETTFLNLEYFSDRGQYAAIPWGEPRPTEEEDYMTFWEAFCFMCDKVRRRCYTVKKFSLEAVTVHTKDPAWKKVGIDKSKLPELAIAFPEAAKGRVTEYELNTINYVLMHLKRTLGNYENDSIPKDVLAKYSLMLGIKKHIEEVLHYESKPYSEAYADSDEPVSDEQVEAISNAIAKMWDGLADRLIEKEQTYTSLYDSSSKDNDELSYSDYHQPRKESFIFKDKTPKKILNSVKEHVIGQEEAIKTLATAVYFHFYKRTLADIPFHRANTILIGPTGCGKTFIVSKLAEVLGLPFVSVDCTQLTPEGFVGNSSDYWIDVLRSKSIDGRTLKGLVYFDEVDKICVPSFAPLDSAATSFNTVTIQQGLLKMLESEIIDVKPNTRAAVFGGSNTQLDTRDVYFVAGGSFAGMSDIIERDFEAKDLINMGMIPELVGRLPYIATLENLNVEGIKGVMFSSASSPLKQYEKIFESFGVYIRLTDDATEKVVEEVLDTGTGARALHSILERILRNALYSVPESNLKRELVIDADYVTHSLTKLN